MSGKGSDHGQLNNWASSMTTRDTNDWLWSTRPRVYRTPILSHRGGMTHVCVSKLTIRGSDNGFLPGRWTNAVILLIGSLGTNFSEIDMYAFSITKMQCRRENGGHLVSTSMCQLLIETMQTRGVLITIGQSRQYSVLKILDIFVEKLTYVHEIKSMGVFSFVSGIMEALN